ncbi:unnamed protein product [Amoebophrya sp. A120]|nr:unnamed protein product [Amoebophrya sp. A120]|eukprot:GSA120T00007955001.1
MASGSTATAPSNRPPGILNTSHDREDRQENFSSKQSLSAASGASRSYAPTSRSNGGSKQSTEQNRPQRQERNINYRFFADPGAKPAYGSLRPRTAAQKKKARSKKAKEKEELYLHGMQAQPFMFTPEMKRNVNHEESGRGRRECWTKSNNKANNNTDKPVNTSSDDATATAAQRGATATPPAQLHKNQQPKKQPSSHLQPHRQSGGSEIRRAPASAQHVTTKYDAALMQVRHKFPDVCWHFLQGKCTHGAEKCRFWHPGESEVEALVEEANDAVGSKNECSTTQEAQANSASMFYGPEPPVDLIYCPDAMNSSSANDALTSRLDTYSTTGAEQEESSSLHSAGGHTSQHTTSAASGRKRSKSGISSTSGGAGKTAVSSSLASTTSTSASGVVPGMGPPILMSNANSNPSNSMNTAGNSNYRYPVVPENLHPVAIAGRGGEIREFNHIRRDAAYPASQEEHEAILMQQRRLWLERHYFHLAATKVVQQRRAMQAQAALAMHEYLQRAEVEQYDNGDGASQNSTSNASPSFETEHDREYYYNANNHQHYHGGVEPPTVAPTAAALGTASTTANGTTRIPPLLSGSSPAYYRDPLAEQIAWERAARASAYSSTSTAATAPGAGPGAPYLQKPAENATTSVVLEQQQSQHDDPAFPPDRALFGSVLQTTNKRPAVVTGSNRLPQRNGTGRPPGNKLFIQAGEHDGQDGAIMHPPANEDHATTSSSTGVTSYNPHNQRTGANFPVQPPSPPAFLRQQLEARLREQMMDRNYPLYDTTRTQQGAKRSSSQLAQGAAFSQQHDFPPTYTASFQKSNLVVYQHPTSMTTSSSRAAAKMNKAVVLSAPPGLGSDSEGEGEVEQHYGDLAAAAASATTPTDPWSRRG